MNKQSECFCFFSRDNNKLPRNYVIKLGKRTDLHLLNAEN